MKQHLLNYTILIEPDTRTGSDASCFSIFCPALGLADSGDTVEEAIKNMKAMIQFHLACLKKEHERIPEEQTERSMVTMIQVPYPRHA